ncbi:PTS mannose/fructose/sorbose transporter subunit IIAB [Lactobacillus jensenii]|uniref:PTS mannose/fructose/sorbose transporter subunit IIAB n=1 Tax=Lactobacillus jensenii TaxID=109790 RepID=UPI002870B133|nr:PTS sugar transporter subunit IIB [Lactobacillus jensenii]
MPNLLLISHGSYAKATLNSCEMILGKLNNVKAIEFKQTMNQDDLLEEIEAIAKTFTKLDAILVDFTGGTPANTAIRFQAKHPEVKIYTGLSFSLLLAVASGTPFSEAYKQVAQTSGLLGEQKTEEKIKTNVSTKNSPRKTAMFVRIDERLIHGQVATMWTNALKLTRLMVIDDQIVKSSIQKTALKTACPNGIHLSILIAAGAAKRINNNQYIGQTVLILVKKPSILKQLVDLGVKLPEINVGNMSTKEGSHQVAKSVAVTKDDINDFKYLAKKGLTIYHQMIPSEAREDFINLLKTNGGQN